MPMFEPDDKHNYKRWAITQRLNELKKALQREWTQKRQEEFDNLKKDLDG